MDDDGGHAGVVGDSKMSGEESPFVVHKHPR